jgi:hypothetical protein
MNEHVPGIQQGVDLNLFRCGRREKDHCIRDLLPGAAGDGPRRKRPKLMIDAPRILAWCWRAGDLRSWTSPRLRWHAHARVGQPVHLLQRARQCRVCEGAHRAARRASRRRLRRGVRTCYDGPSAENGAPHGDQNSGERSDVVRAALHPGRGGRSIAAWSVARRSPSTVVARREMRNRNSRQHQARKRHPARRQSVPETLLPARPLADHLAQVLQVRPDGVRACALRIALRDDGSWG